MRRRATILALLLFSAAVCQAGDKDERWLEIRSPHFAVISNADEKLARRAAAQFEQFREVFRRAMPQWRVDSGTSLVILAVKDEKSFKAVLPELWDRKGAARPSGYFLRGFGKDYVALRLDAVGDNPYHVIYHEYAHDLMSLNFSVVPLWLGEGIAEFFGHTVISARESRLGVPSPGQLRLLRKSKLLPLETLFAVDYSSPYYSEETMTSIFYAQSWALTHMLMVADQGTRRDQIADFLRLLEQDVPAAEAAPRAFGDLAALSRRLEAYIRQASYSSLAVSASRTGPRENAPPAVSAIEERPVFLERSRRAADDFSYSLREIPIAESLAIRADFLLHNDRLTEARKVLTDALWLNPDLALANEAMGFLLFRQGDRAAAEKWFANAVELDSQNFLAHFYHALAMAREGEEIGDFDAAEKHLRRAIELNPGYAPAYSMLALALSAGEGLTPGTQNPRLAEALRLARRAVELEPGGLEHQLRVGSVLLRMERVDEAKRMAQRLSAAARTDDERARAVVFHEEIRKFQEFLARRTAYEAQLAAEQKSLDERRLSRPQPAVIPSEARNPSSLTPPSDANASIEGAIASVVCYDSSALDLTVDRGSVSASGEPGRTIKLHSDNFLRIEYSGANWQPPKDFQPCKHLAGLRVKITYRVVFSQPFAGEILAIEIKK